MGKYFHVLIPRPFTHTHKEEIYFVIEIKISLKVQGTQEMTLCNIEATHYWESPSRHLSTRISLFPGGTPHTNERDIPIDWPRYFTYSIYPPYSSSISSVSHYWQYIQVS